MSIVMLTVHTKISERWIWFDIKNLTSYRNLHRLNDFCLKEECAWNTQACNRDAKSRSNLNWGNDWTRKPDQRDTAR